MKKFITLCCSLALLLSVTATALTLTAEAAGETSTGSISVDVGAQWDRQDERQDHLEIPFKLDNCSFQARALGNTQAVTNQFEKISLYTRLGENGTEYKWYTLGELNAMKNDANMPYVVRTAQFGSLLFIAMDCYWGGAKDLLPSYVKAVKIEAGMTFAVYGEDHWSWNGGDTVPLQYTESEECTAEDIYLTITPSRESKKNDVYNLLAPQEGDEISFELKDWHYPLNYKLTNADIASAEIVYNSVGGITQPVDPALLTLESDFSKTNIASPVKAVYNGLEGTETTYVANITGALSVKAGSSERKDERQDHLEINFDIENCDWACRAMGTTQVVTNQFEKISLYATIGEGTEYKWYTLGELNAMKNNAGMPYVVRTAQHGTTLFIAMDCYWGGDKDFLPSNVKAVMLEKGLVFATYSGDHWEWPNPDPVAETYGVAAQAPLMQDVIVEIEHKSGKENDVYNYATLVEGDTLTVLTGPQQTEYEVNEAFNAKGVTLAAVYNSYGGRKLTVGDNANIEYEYDFSTTGKKTVTGSYGGKTFSFEVEVVNTITSIEVGTMPTKTTFGLAEDFDATGLVVKVNTPAGNYNVELAELGLSAPDMFTVGTKKITVSYKGFECEFEIKVEDQHPEAEITFYTGSNVTFTDQYGCMAVRFNLNNIETFNNKTKALYRVDNCNNAKDHISMKISDHYKGEKLKVGEWYTVAQLMNTTDVNGTSYIERISQFGETLLFHLDTYMGEAPTKEFIIDDVAAIKFDAGFFFVDYYNDTWGMNDITDYWVLENAILRHDLLIEMNLLGIAWVRPYADSDDALTVKSKPSKLEYEVDEKLDTAGLVIHCKYADGFEEDVAVDANNCRYDFSEVGEATVAITYNEKKITFTATVKEAQNTEKPDDEKDTGCCSAVTPVVGLTAAVGILSLVFVALKKKRDE